MAPGDALLAAALQGINSGAAAKACLSALAGAQLPSSQALLGFGHQQQQWHVASGTDGAGTASDPATRSTTPCTLRSSTSTQQREQQPMAPCHGITGLNPAGISEGNLAAQPGSAGVGTAPTPLLSWAARHTQHHQQQQHQHQQQHVQQLHSNLPALPPPQLIQRRFLLQHQHHVRSLSAAAGALRSLSTLGQPNSTAKPTGSATAASAPPAGSSAPKAADEVERGGSGAPSKQQEEEVDSLWTSPNMLSLARAASAPWIAWLILQDSWPWAIGATLVSGLTDWADGALARHLKQSSVLGSYLDPVADKALVACVLSALCYKGLAPMWLGGLVVGRDVALVAGGFVHRWRALGWRPLSTLTAQEFFATTGGGAAPMVQPIMISKVNTVLQLALVAGCMSRAWAGLPGPEVLGALEVLTAGTTAASMAAYGWLYYTGKLLPVQR